MAHQYNGYEFYFKIGEDVLTFPITPSELSIKVGSNNKTVTLINEGDINILKSPSLVEVEFTARFPMRQYPYAREFNEFITYHDKFKELKENKKSFRFIVARTTPKNSILWETNLLVALESYNLNESTDEGDDVLVDFKLKQYKEYGVKIIPAESTDSTKSDGNTSTNATPSTSTSTSTSDKTRPTDGKGEESTTYTVQSGDCLYNIAKAAYGDANKWKEIYEANKTAIEEDAKKHGKASSSNGHWIWPGLKLTIPGTKVKDLKVTKLW